MDTLWKPAEIYKNLQKLYGYPNEMYSAYDLLQNPTKPTEPTKPT